ncbi:MAG: amidohydrolase [Calditrichaeota bacterium]|nr:amidohydrolase [Calditrichota bacterium]
MVRLIFSGILLFSVFTLSSCQSEKGQKADLILFNGKVVTLDSLNTVAEAIAVKGDRILATGSNSAIKKLSGDHTKFIDLKGALAVPGLIEGHAHFLGLGRALLNLDLTRAQSWQDIVDSVAQRVQRAKPGEWIIGRGWHQEKWKTKPKKLVEGYPVHEALSRVSPDNPVILTHVSGHAVFVNQKALKLAGINSATPDPEGGRIIRDEKGQPTGVLLENAEELVRKVYKKSGAPQSEDLKLRAAQKAMQECLRNGITSFHDAGASYEDVDFFKTLAEREQLKIRLYVMLSVSNRQLKQKIDQYRLIGYGNGFLTVRAIKRYMDGALGSRGAWLLKPYNDLPSSSGMNTVSPDTLLETARIAIKHGFQLCTHAIGDRANRETLNIYETVFNENPAKTDLRWRIEHAQLIHPRDVPRFAELGVIASMQGIHCTSDGPWVPARIGEKRAREEGYLWQTLWQSGAVVTNGTDAPVEAVDPMANFYALITRRMDNGKYFYPEQSLSADQALRAYTLNNAYAAFEEDLKGSLEAGKLADITVLSRDILTVTPDRIKNTKVLYTIVGGRVLYSSKRGD